MKRQHSLKKSVVGMVAFGAILLVSAGLFTGCNKYEEGSVTYNERTGVVTIPGATIITGGNEYEESAPLPDSGLAFVTTQDGGQYFYSPLQGDLEELTKASSKDAIVRCLLYAYGEDASSLSITATEELETGITVDVLNSSEVRFTNMAHRWAGVERATEDDYWQVIPPSRWFSVDLMAIFEAEWDDIIQINEHPSVKMVYEQGDVFNTYGSVAKLALVATPVFVNLPENFHQANEDAMNSNLSLWVRVNVCDGIDFTFFLVKLVLGEVGGDLLVDVITDVTVDVIVDVTQEAILQAISDNVSDEELARDLGNSVLKSIINALISGGSSSSLSSLPNPSPESQESVTLATLYTILKVLKIFVSVAEEVTSVYDEARYLPYDTWTIGLTPGNTRIVLSWAQYPEDLDAHLWTPSIEGNTYHIYYWAQYLGHSSIPPYADLDRDDVTSYGPETMTIYESYPGTYTFAVHNYSEDAYLTESEAVVKIYDEEGLIRTFTVPTYGSGLWWHVFELNGSTGTITSLNYLSNYPPFDYGSSMLRTKETKE